MKPKRDRIIEQLRRHPRVGGRWMFDVEMNEYVRDDGVKAYARSHCSLGENGGESYYTVWYVEWPIAGPIADDDWLSRDRASLPGHVERLDDIFHRRWFVR